jgi:hypothetical protein
MASAQDARMRHFESSREVLAEIKRDRFRHPDPLVQRRMEVLWLTRLFLPSYSRNLNLIERLCKFVKKAVLNSRHQASFTQFRRATDHCLDQLSTKYRSQIATLMTPAFQTFEYVSLLAA